jgi:carbon storage regulator
MLVLSRHKNESIMIGDDIEITIVSVKGLNVKIGVAAPDNVPIHRKEVYLKIKENKNVHGV